jgi:squalene cyclase
LDAALRDRRNGPGKDPGSAAAINAGLEWLSLAQDRSRTADGGVAREFGLINGWASSYPETTGYIVPTLLEHADSANDLETRARRMLDWLVSIQLEDGAFQGGMVDQEPIQPVTFNTGQILFGLVAGTERFGDTYARAMSRAADWLVATQSDDGCWRNHASPFAEPGEKTYDTHVAWALFEATRLTGRKDWGEAGLANVRWALRHQRPNGFLDSCCLSDPHAPLTHTLGYALRGIVEAYRFSREREFLDAARRMADGIRSALGAGGFLAGRLNERWHGTTDWVCLTGTVQIGACWLLLYEEEGRDEDLDAGLAANAYVRRTLDPVGESDTRGAVRGSFPIDGNYNPFQFPNWAAKFMIDACALEQRIVGSRERA